MTQSMQQIEHDIERSRARLDATIDRIQNRLSVSGVIDDLVGTARTTETFSSAYDHTLAVVRRNPVPVILIAAGLGWLIHRLVTETDRGRMLVPVDPSLRVPVLNTGAARVYDPDASPLHPAHDVIETRREASARL